MWSTQARTRSMAVVGVLYGSAPPSWAGLVAANGRTHVRVRSFRHLLIVIPQAKRIIQIRIRRSGTVGEPTKEQVVSCSSCCGIEL